MPHFSVCKRNCIVCIFLLYVSNRIRLKPKIFLKNQEIYYIISDSDMGEKKGEIKVLPNQSGKIQSYQNVLQKQLINSLLVMQSPPSFSGTLYLKKTQKKHFG